MKMKSRNFYILLAIALIVAMVAGSLAIYDHVKPTTYAASGDNVYQGATFGTNGVPYVTDATQGLIGTDPDLTFNGTTLDTNGNPPEAPTGRGATYVIAASNSPAIWKAQADVVCTGVKATGGDDVTIGNTITAVGNQDILFAPGVYWFSNVVQKTGPFKLKGTGIVQYSGASAPISGTIFRLADNYSAGNNPFFLQIHTDTNNAVTISGVQFYGAGQLSGGIMLTGFGRNTYIDHCEFQKIHYASITLDNCDSVFIDHNGFDYNDAVHAPFEGTVNADVVLLNSPYIWFTNNNMVSAGQNSSLYANNCNQLHIETNHFEVGLDGLVLTQTNTYYSTFIVSNYFKNYTRYAMNLTLYGATVEANQIDQSQASTPYSDIYLNGGTAYKLIGNGLTGNGKQNYGITAASISNSVISENTLSGYLQALQMNITSPIQVVVYNNIGYIAPGEIRTISGSISTLTQDAFNSVDNPFGQSVRVLSLNINVSTGATATTPDIDCGIGNSATTDYTTLFDDLPGETIGYYTSTIATPGTQTVPQTWASGSGNRYLNMSIKGAAATGMVATWTVTVMGN
jgi:hypothetical protein